MADEHQEKAENFSDHEQAEDFRDNARDNEKKKFFDEDFFSGARFSFESFSEAVRDAEKGFSDAFLASVPPEVTEHLVNSQKELILAGRRMLDLSMKKLEKTAARAKEVHERQKQKKEEAKAAKQEQAEDAEAPPEEE